MPLNDLSGKSACDSWDMNIVAIRACLLTVEQSRDLEAIIRALDQIIKYAEQLKWLAKGER